MTLHAKMTMSDLQKYPLNHNLIKNVEEIVIFFNPKSVYFCEVSPLLLINKKCANLFRRETVNKNKQFQVGFPSKFSLNEIHENERTKFVFVWFKIFANFDVFSTSFSRKFRPFSRNFCSILV